MEHPRNDAPEPDTPGPDSPGSDSPGSDSPSSDSPSSDSPGSDTPRPDSPRGDAEEELRPQDEDDAAVLRERSSGAHAEQVTDEANLRADPTPPGQ